MNAGRVVVVAGREAEQTRAARQGQGVEEVRAAKDPLLNLGHARPVGIDDDVVRTYQHVDLGPRRECVRNLPL